MTSRPGIFLLVICFCFTISCKDEPEPLVKEYNIAWESNLRSHYTTDLLVPSDFNSFLEVNDGFIVALKPFDFNVKKTIIAKTDATGNVVSDVEYVGELPLHMYKDDAGGFYVISSLGLAGSYRVRVFNFSLQLQSTRDVELSLPTFSKVFFVQNAIIRLRSDDLTIEMSDIDGSERWKKPLSEFGFQNFINPVFVVVKNSAEVTFSAFESNHFHLAHVQRESGKVLWTQSYSYIDDFAAVNFNFNHTWSENGKLYFTGTKELPTGRQLLVYILNSKGSLELFKDITPSLDKPFYPGYIVPTSDNGFILTVGTDISTDPAYFRLLKFDSKGNAGWIGSFHELGYDFLSSISELRNADIVFMTYNGYMAAITPSY